MTCKTSLGATELLDNVRCDTEVVRGIVADEDPVDAAAGDLGDHARVVARALKKFGAGFEFGAAPAPSTNVIRGRMRAYSWSASSGKPTLYVRDVLG